MSRKPRKIFFPKTRLAELVARPGGIPRDLAIEAAVDAIQELRGESDKMIGLLIGGIGDTVKGAQNGELNDDDLLQVLRCADQIVTLAGTFGYQYLETASRSLCDVTDGLMRAGMHHLAPVAVHIQSMLLLGPGTSLPPDQASVVLAELAKILTHYKFGSLATPDDVGEEQAVAAAAG